LYKLDYHLHTDYSLDCYEPMVNIIKGAIAHDLDEIVITDHVDFTREMQPVRGSIDYDKYITQLFDFKNIYSNKIKIKFGIELGAEPLEHKKINEFLKKYKYDFIIMSSHTTAGYDLWARELFIGRSKKESYSMYFEEILQNIKLVEKFCVYGHLDFIPRYWRTGDNSLVYEDYKDIIDSILKALIEKGKGVEVNTSGIRYGLNTVHPQLSILKRYKELGGEILTLGSDAHKQKDVASDFDKGYEIIKAAGFKYLTRFDNLEPEFFEIKF